MLKMDQILWNAVRQRSLKMVPHKLVGVEFRRIGRKSLRLQAGVFVKALTDRIPSMDPATIPQEENGASQMSEQIDQKLRHFGVFDVLVGVKLSIQGNSLLLRRNTDRRDGRNLLPVAGTLQNRGFSSRRPGAANAGDERKTGFIQEDQMGTTLFGVFLYGASASVSIPEWPLRPVPEPVSPVSDSSNPDFPGPATHDGDGSELQTSARSLPPPGAGSKDRSHNQSLWPPSKESWPNPSSGAMKVWGACRKPAWRSTPYRLSYRMPPARGKQNLQNNRSSWLRPTNSTLFPATQWRVGGASRVVSGFHGVAWTQYSMFSIIYA